MLMWLGVSLGVAFGSAVLPLVSVEIFVLGLVANHPEIPWLLLGAVIAVGQVAGKLVHYYAARGSLRLPRFLHRRERTPSARRQRWAQRTKRLRAWAGRVTDRCHRHPRWMFGTYSVSALVGLPPGRFVRFSLLAAAPAMMAGWLF
jgi:membrane protein YqaA with SNARE-associated domain